MELAALIVSGVLGLAGVAVGGLGLWLGYRERAASHRQTLYEKQVDAYKVILASIRAMEDKAQQHMPDHSSIPSKTDLWTVSQSFRPEYNLVLQALRENRVLLTDPLIAKFHHAANDWLGIDDSMFPIEGYAVVLKMWEGYLAAEAAVRETLGVEPLSAETLQAINSLSRARPGRRRDYGDQSTPSAVSALPTYVASEPDDESGRPRLQEGEP